MSDFFLCRNFIKIIKNSEQISFDNHAIKRTKWMTKTRNSFVFLNFFSYSYFANSFSIFFALHEHFQHEQTHCRPKFFEQLFAEAWWSIFSKVFSHSTHITSKSLLEISKAFFSFSKILSHMGIACFSIFLNSVMVLMNLMCKEGKCQEIGLLAVFDDFLKFRH